MKYEVIRTETADEGIRKFILYAAQNIGNEVVLKKLDYMKESILALKDNSDIGTDPCIFY